MSEQQKPRPIYRADGPIDKIVQVRLSNLYSRFTDVLATMHNHGEITVPHVKKLAEILTIEVESQATTIATITLGT